MGERVNYHDQLSVWYHVHNFYGYPLTFTHFYCPNYTSTTHDNLSYDSLKDLSLISLSGFSQLHEI